MATDNWLDGNDPWNTASDWSAGVPTSTSNVAIAQGDPLIDAAVGADCRARLDRGDSIRSRVIDLN